MAVADGTLKGRRALVTGATSGLGRATALALADAGAEIAVHGRDRERGEEVVAAIRSGGGSAEFFAADLTDPVALRELAEEIGDVDVLVNNAGIAWFGESADLDLDTFDRLFAANVRAPYYTVAAFAPRMAAAGGGTIVNVGSMAGTVGMAGGAAYGATKAGLAAMTRSWAVEFAADGVRVNTIAAGPIYTGIQSTEETAAVGATTPMDRAAKPDEIAAVIVFLASSHSSYLTGATVAADGGRTAV
jgi:NAD(P)-dependent dehydrogenase (short-subunit alcohol dehydrogenase family)